MFIVRFQGLIRFHFDFLEGDGRAGAASQMLSASVGRWAVSVFVMFAMLMTCQDLFIRKLMFLMHAF